MSFTPDDINSRSNCVGREAPGGDLSEWLGNVDFDEVLAELTHRVEGMPVTGDPDVDHVVVGGDLNLEGEEVTEWLESDLTCADILEGDGR